MYRTLMWGAVLALCVTAVASADVLTIANGTAGYDSMVQDGYLRENGTDGPTGGDMNWGAAQADVRWYSDAGSARAAKGRRHMLVKFDLSSIPAGSTITSAEFGIYFYGSSGPTAGYSLSRLKAGKSWVEGVNSGATVNPGEVTYNSQASGGAAWDAQGAMGAGDIDLASTIPWTRSSGYTRIDVTSFVQGWVDVGGWANNGMLMWGGTDTGNTYSRIVTKEDTTHTIDAVSTATIRPYLTVTYTPEPASLILLVLGAAPLLRRRR